MTSRFPRAWRVSTLAAAATLAASASFANDLNTCAAIQTQAERLACYDKLAGRQPQAAPAAAAAQPTPAQPAATQPPAAVGPTSAQPAPVAGSPRKAAPAPPAAGPAPAPGAAGTSTAGAATTPVAGAAGTPAPGTAEAFGLYKAEHPAAPKSGIDAVTSKVVDLKYDGYGKETIWLEGGAIWQLAESDPILAKGDEVTIKRATFGSYLMATAAGREHRVKRLR